MSNLPPVPIRIRDLSTDGITLLDDRTGIELHRLWVALDRETGDVLAVDEDRGDCFDKAVRAANK